MLTTTLPIDASSIIQRHVPPKHLLEGGAEECDGLTIAADTCAATRPMYRSVGAVLKVANGDVQLTATQTAHATIGGPQKKYCRQSCFDNGAGYPGDQDVCLSGHYNATGGDCRFNNSKYLSRYSDPSAGTPTGHSLAALAGGQGASKVHVKCGVNKIVDCAVVNATTGTEECKTTSNVFCNAIQGEGRQHQSPTEAEKEACEYAPHACTFAARLD